MRLHQIAKWISLDDLWSRGQARRYSAATPRLLRGYSAATPRLLRGYSVATPPAGAPVFRGYNSLIQNGYRNPVTRKRKLRTLQISSNNPRTPLVFEFEAGDKLATLKMSKPKRSFSTK